MFQNSVRCREKPTALVGDASPRIKSEMNRGRIKCSLWQRFQASANLGEPARGLDGDTSRFAAAVPRVFIEVGYGRARGRPNRDPDLSVQRRD